MDEGGLVPNNHGLTDEKSNFSFHDEMRHSLRKFLDNLKVEAEPCVSIDVRLATRLVIQYDNDKVEIPSLHTKQTLYFSLVLVVRMAFQAWRGGSYGRISEYLKRVNI